MGFRPETSDRSPYAGASRNLVNIKAEVIIPIWKAIPIGKPRKLNFFKDGEVSVEEAFYYARYKLSTDESMKDFGSMEPQINDKYPYRGLFFSRKGLILGEN